MTIEEIKQYMKKNNITQKVLAEKSQIPLGSLRNLFSYRIKNPGLETINKIIKALEDITGENILTIIKKNEMSNTFTTKNKANIFDNEGKLTEIELSPNNANKIIAMIKALEEEEKKLKFKNNITPIFIKPEGNEEEFIPAVARSKDNAVKSVYLTQKEVEDILSQRKNKDE